MKYYKKRKGVEDEKERVIIKDEEINIDGYSPSNANKIFLGDVSVRESIEKSLNVPAVKTLSKVGVKRAKKFAEKNGIDFNEKKYKNKFSLFLYFI